MSSLFLFSWQEMVPDDHSVFVPRERLGDLLETDAREVAKMQVRAVTQINTSNFSPSPPLSLSLPPSPPPSLTPSLALILSPRL